MNVDDDEPLDWQDAADAEALLFALAGESEVAELPPWIGRLEALLLVGVLTGPPPTEELAALSDAEEDSDGGRWIFARRLDAEADARPVVEAARRWAAGGGRAALSVGYGVIEERAVFGPALDAVAAVNRDADSPGVWVDATVHAVVGGPARASGDAFSLARSPRPSRARPPSRWRGFAIGFAAAAAITVAVALPMMTPPHQGFGAQIYVSGEPKTRGGEGEYRANDLLHVVLQGPAGSHGTMFLLDSTDQLLLPAPRLVDAEFTARLPHRTVDLSLDDQPGLEQFIGVVSPNPIGAARLRAVVVEANRATNRAARLASLRTQIAALFGDDAYELVVAEEIRHIK